MSTGWRVDHAQHERSMDRQPIDLLIVGTLGGGGIHHYVDEQAERLPDHLSVRVFDMASQPTGSGLLWFVVSFLHSLWAALRFPFQRPPDIVHVHTSHRFSFYRASFYVLFATYVWRRPVLLHIHGSSFDKFANTDDPGARWLQSVVFAAVDRIVVLSDYWRDVLGSQVSTDKIDVLPNAVDPDEYDPGFGDDPLHIVFVSNLIKRKGVRELAEAIETLQDRDVTFRATIAGKGPLSDVVEDLAVRYENIDAPGYVSESRKRALLNSGAVLVLPTYAEGLPIAMLEGMASGNAIVSTTVGSIPEVIEEENGVLIEPGDPDALSDALEMLVSSPSVTKRMAQRNRSLVEEQFSWDEAIQRLERIYADEYENTDVTSP